MLFRRFLCPLLTVAACGVDPGNEPTPAASIDDDYTQQNTLSAFTDDEVQAVINAHCLRCHGASNDIDFTDFVAATVDVWEHTDFCASVGMPRITAGNRNLSLAYLKVAAAALGTAAVCGSPMPYSRNDEPLSEEELERFGLWIDAME